jgi:hypothetical protein
MLIHPKNLRLAGMIVLILGALAEAHGPCAGGHCGSPLGVPCVPQRVTYGYFPTQWRRWPIEHVEAVAPGEPETVPTPAAQPLPEAPPQDEIPQPPSGPAEKPPEEPSAPPFDTGPPTQPPAAPPGGEMPLPPPLEDEPFAPPPSESPLPPFEDAPPGLPPAESPVPGATPEPPADTKPSEELPEPPGQAPPPDLDAPPTMPDDDPFKDEPESPMPPAAGAPKPDTGRLDEPHRPLPHAARWRAPGGTVAARVEAEPTAAALIPDEPRRLQVDAIDAADAGPALAPARPFRANPLRSASRGGRGESIVPTASYTGAAAVADGNDSAWRRNPLRSN